MKIGMPVAFLVSEPRLWPTTRHRQSQDPSVKSLMNKDITPLTPGDDESNRGVRPSGNAEGCEVPDVIIFRDY